MVEVEQPMPVVVHEVEQPRPMVEVEQPTLVVEVEQPTPAVQVEPPTDCMAEVEAAVAGPSPRARVVGPLLREARWYDAGGVPGQRRLHRSVHLRDEDGEPLDLIVRHHRVLELPALRHGRLPFVQNAGDEFVAVVLSLLVVVGQRLAVVLVAVVLCRRWRLPC
jgi:hypothetical protein